MPGKRQRKSFLPFWRIPWTEESRAAPTMLPAMTTPLALISTKGMNSVTGPRDSTARGNNGWGCYTGCRGFGWASSKPPSAVLKFSSRGVAQPGRAPGSGPGGRRFKSSLPDQSFQADKQHFWIFITAAVDDFEANKASEFKIARLQSAIFIRSLAWRSRISPRHLLGCAMFPHRKHPQAFTRGKPRHRFLENPQKTLWITIHCVRCSYVE